MCGDGLGHSVGIEPPAGIQEGLPGGEFDNDQFRSGIDIDELAEHAARRAMPRRPIAGRRRRFAEYSDKGVMGFINPPPRPISGG